MNYRALRVIAVAACLTHIQSCHTTGATSIRKARAAYNDAINETNDQQLLQYVVRARYGESSGLLAVTSVAANMRVSTSVSTDIGFGPSENYRGNLVPFSGTIAYEENPTISYVPLQGDLYIRQLLSPVPLDLVILLLHEVVDLETVFAGLVSSLNGLRNPIQLTPDAEASEADFRRVVQLLSGLARREDIDILTRTEDDTFVLLVRAGESGHSDDARELVTLLGYPKLAEGTADLELPLTLGYGRPATPGVALGTRSVYGLLEILMFAIDVPDEDVESGRAYAALSAGYAGERLRVHHSESEPEDSVVAVPHRGGWYYIAGTDMETKRFFRLIRLLWSARVAGTANQQAAPILTVPVSR